MRIRWRNDDGSEEVREVGRLEIWVAGVPVEVTSHAEPEQLKLRVEADDQRWAAFVIRPGAANLITLELDVHERGKTDRAQPTN